MRTALIVSILVAAFLLEPLSAGWLLAICAGHSWYRDSRGLLRSGAGQAGVEVAESAQEILVPGDRLYALREYVWVARSKHVCDMAGDSLIDITPPRDSGGNTELRRISVDQPRPADATGQP